MKKYFPIILSSVLSTALSFMICYTYFKKVEKDTQQSERSKLVNNKDLVLSGSLERHFTSSAPTNFINAANRCKSAVVALRVLQKEDESFSRKKQLSKSNGSGVIIDEQGYIVTNLHVVENAVEIEATLEDKRVFRAELVGYDEATDLAVLKINTNNLPHIIFGNSDSLQIGEWVLAIGNPFKLQSTVTAGIVSAKARNINILKKQGIESFIQTDAAINSGNSGGALINTLGELVGINTAIMTESGKYEGFSFAVPSNLVRKIVFDIREFGAVQRGWMGVKILNVDGQRAKDLDLEFVKGVYIELVEKDGAAKMSGLKRADVITKIENIEINSAPEFMEKIAKYRPGDELEITYIRDGKIKTTKVTLRNQLNTTDFIAVRKDPVLKKLGLELRELDGIEKQRLNTSGVLVVSIQKNSIIDYTNMDPGFVLTKINHQEIHSVDEFIQVLMNEKGEILLEGFYENYPGVFPYTFIHN